MREKTSVSWAIVLMIGLIFTPCSHSASAEKLIIGIGQEPTSMDPSYAFVGGDYVVVENYGEYLVNRTTSGELTPGLADSWKLSPDGKVIEFTLRKGVKFHSGDPLTTKDVEFSLHRGGEKSTTVRTRLKYVEKFEIIDDYHFKIHFRAPDVTFIPYRGAAMIVSKSYYDRVGEEKFMKQPSGTGPYKFVRHVPGDYVDIDRFEEYWGEKPSVKEARFLFVSEDTTRVAKLKAGEVDFITSCPYPSVSDIEKTPGLKVIKFSSGHPTALLGFNNKNPKTPWYDRRVRLAMAYAIDCDAIIKNILFGLAHHWAWLKPDQLGYDPDLKPYPYDPKKAKELLAEAGYPKGFDFKLYWPITGRTSLAREMVEAIASYLEAIGIRTKLSGEEWAAYYARHRAAKKPDVEYVNFITAGPVAGAVESTAFLESIISTDGGFSVYTNPEVDKLIAEARGTLDDNKRGEIVKKAIAKAHEDVPIVPVANLIAVYGMKQNIDFIPTQKYPFDIVLVKDITIK